MADCLVLDIQKEKEKLRMGINLLGKTESTVQHYSEQEISFPQINRIYEEITTLLNKANNEGSLEWTLVQELKKDCQLLYDQLLTKIVKDRLKTAQEENLILSLDESIVYLPWEILYDGENFLCLKFNLGRSMRIKDIPHEPRYRKTSAALKMLILADPQNNLPHANTEAQVIKNTLDKMREIIHVDFKATQIDTDYIKKNIRDYDILHYAGHAQYCLEAPQESGWILEDNRLKAKDILKMGESGMLPTLVFAHACETGNSSIVNTESGEQIYSLARPFLVSGVRHYIATICKIPDEASMFFAKEFYANLILDKPLGEVVRLARQGLIKRYGENQISWMGYLLFGDPMFRLWKQVTPLPLAKGRRYSKLLKACLAICLVLFSISLAYKIMPHKYPSLNKLYEEGKNQEIISLCTQVLSKETENLQCLELMGDVYERLGKRNAALGYYFKYATSSERKKDQQQLANSFTKIAWVYYLMGDYPKAFDFYNKAIELAEKINNKLIEAVALRKLAVWYIDKEDYEKALELLFKSSEINRQRQDVVEQRYNLACDYFDIALVFSDKDDYETAKEFYKKSMDIFKSINNVSQLSDYYSNMAELYKIDKEYHKSEKFYNLSLEIDAKLNNLPSLASTYSMIAELYWEMEDPLRAEENFNKSLALHEKIEDPVGLAEVYWSLGSFYKENGQDQKALIYLKKAEGIYKDIDTPDHKAIIAEIEELENRMGQF